MSAADLEGAVSRSDKLRPRTKQLYLQHVRAFLAFVDRGPRTAESVMAWRDEMRARKVRPQSINVALNAVRFAAQEAGARFYTPAVERLPVKAGVPRAEREDAVALTWSQGRRLVQACAGTHPRDLRDRAMIVLGLRTGLLRFSLCGIKLKDMLIDGPELTLTFTKKGGARHTLRLDPVSRAAVLPWIDWLASQGVASGLLFRSLGRPQVLHGDAIEIRPKLTPDGLYRILQQRGEAVRLPDLSPYVFCSTFRAWARRVGATPAQLALVTGHRFNYADQPADLVPANFLLPSFEASSLRGDGPETAETSEDLDVPEAP
jgi:integrase